MSASGFVIGEFTCKATTEILGDPQCLFAASRPWTFRRKAESQVGQGTLLILINLDNRDGKRFECLRVGISCRRGLPESWHDDDVVDIGFGP
jgi:hypothetical protein